jgi:hypothetical protein
MISRPHWFPELWTQLPLPRLFDDDEDVGGTGRWSFAIVTIERSGWVTLPAVARGAFEGRGSLRLSSRGEVALLRCGGGGRPVVVRPIQRLCAWEALVTRSPAVRASRPKRKAPSVCAVRNWRRLARMYG